MTIKELENVLADLKQKTKNNPEYVDKTDEEIDSLMINGFFMGYLEGRMQRDLLYAIAEIMGYEVNVGIIDEIEEKRMKVFTKVDQKGDK